MKPILERTTIKEILELSDRPTLDEVKKNYKRLALKYHPDINKTPEANEYMKRINQAYAVAMQKAPQVNQAPQPVRRETIVVVVTYYGGSYSSWTNEGTTGGINW